MGRKAGSWCTVSQCAPFEFPRNSSKLFSKPVCALAVFTGFGRHSCRCSRGCFFTPIFMIFFPFELQSKPAVFLLFFLEELLLQAFSELSHLPVSAAAPRGHPWNVHQPISVKTKSLVDLSRERDAFHAPLMCSWITSCETLPVLSFYPISPCPPTSPLPFHFRHIIW